MLKGPKGFTIIEVVLVLAIAALIFLVVFLALPALQRSQRDQQRKSQVAELRGAVDNWRANNGGRVIDTFAEANDLMATYFTSQEDPSTGQPYDLVFYPHTVSHTTVTVPPLGSMVYVSGHVCGSDANTYPGGSPSLITGVAGAPSHDISLYALLTRLESADATICIDNR